MINVLFPEPVEPIKAVVCPGSAGIFHYKIKSAKSCQSRPDAGGKIFVFGNIDSRSICCSRILSDGPEVQSESCLKEKNR